MPIGTATQYDGTELAMVIASFQHTAKRLDRILPLVADMLVTAVDDVYEAEGPGWEPLAAATLKSRRGVAGKILQDTGVMVGSTSGVHGSDWAMALAGVAYARFHASGTSHMPVRNPFDLGPFEKDVLDDIADLIVQEAMP